MSEQVKGVTCRTCFSVLFTIGTLIRHITENPNHTFYSFGGVDTTGALVIKLLLEVTEN